MRIGLHDYLIRGLSSKYEREQLRSLIREVLQITRKQLVQYERNDDLLTIEQKVKISALYCSVWNENNKVYCDGVQMFEGLLVQECPDGYYRGYTWNKRYSCWDDIGIKC